MQLITIDVKNKIFDCAAVEGSSNSIQIFFDNTPEEWSSDELGIYALFAKGKTGELFSVDKTTMKCNVPNTMVKENSGFKVTVFAMNSDTENPYRYALEPIWVEVTEGYDSLLASAPDKDNMDAICTLIQVLMGYDEAETERKLNEEERKLADIARGELIEKNSANITSHQDKLNEHDSRISANEDDISTLYGLVEENVGEESYDPESQKAQSGKAVAEAIASIVNSAPETLNTLEELSKALGNDPNFATTIMTLLGGKVDKVDGMGLSSNDYTDEEKANLQQARDDIAELNARADYSENDFKENKEQMKLALNKKVDKVEGKTLSSNDYTDEDKAKLEQAIRDILENRGAISSLEENNDSVHKYLSDVAGVVEEHETRITKNAADVGNLKNQVLELPDKVWVKELVHPVPICEIPATLSTNCEYSFGELTELSLTFPSVANKGDVVYLTFKSGAVATTLAIDTTNTTDVEIVPETNCYYDIFAKFNGSVWLVNYSEYVASEV